ncbi:hypothetical protein KC460_03740 [Candidatus Dependentiae bacterium]|nr:hypothetical protein [Candidatus Dependentiae bacterium]
MQALVDIENSDDNTGTKEITIVSIKQHRKKITKKITFSKKPLTLIDKNNDLITITSEDKQKKSTKSISYLQNQNQQMKAAIDIINLLLLDSTVSKQIKSSTKKTH